MKNKVWFLDMKWKLASFLVWLENITGVAEIKKRRFFKRLEK